MRAVDNRQTPDCDSTETVDGTSPEAIITVQEKKGLPTILKWQQSPLEAPPASTSMR
jgi:hypothetical protein